MDDEYRGMRWSMPLLPDACMIPGRSVFLQARGGISLTATVEDMPGLLPGIWEQFLQRSMVGATLAVALECGGEAMVEATLAVALECGGEVEEECYCNRQTRRRTNMP